MIEVLFVGHSLFDVAYCWALSSLARAAGGVVAVWQPLCVDSPRIFGNIMVQGHRVRRARERGQWQHRRRG